jgi:sialate O-acetylesterase
MRSKIWLLISFVWFIGGTVNAQIRLPNVIGSNMVLQRNQPVPIWGWAYAGKTVEVKFEGQKKSAVADTSGYWKVILSPLATSDKPQDMVITSERSTLYLSNILIGEVWLASGQSNMEIDMKWATTNHPTKGNNPTPDEVKTENSQVRLFNVEMMLSIPDVTTKLGWQESKGEALLHFSSAAYYFSKNLYAKLHIPIGVIQSAWSGRRIEPFTPAAAYTNLPAFKAEVTKSVTSKKPLMIDDLAVGDVYESMIKPLAPYAVHGVIWYQGESNAIISDSLRYTDKMQAMVDSWRKLWANDKLPFYSVLIAPYTYSKYPSHGPHTVYTLPQFWEAQQLALNIPYTGIVNISDLVENIGNLHPPYKWEVGRRLAQIALAKEYGYTDITYTGPRFEMMTVKDNEAVISFNNSKGLKTSDGKSVDNFMIAGEDGKFYPANAKIVDNKVVVSSPDVSKPLNVRFAWIESAQPNLVNSEGFPAFPFRTNGPTWTYTPRN